MQENPPRATDTIDTFAPRVQSLATTAPLHGLDVRKVSALGAEYSVYRMGELALHAIDFVAIAMDFDAGVRSEDVIDDVSGTVRSSV